jgi:hypothetical protein
VSGPVLEAIGDLIRSRRCASQSGLFGEVKIGWMESAARQASPGQTNLRSHCYFVCSLTGGHT